jgi:hypothetical protein
MSYGQDDGYGLLRRWVRDVESHAVEFHMRNGGQVHVPNTRGGVIYPKTEHPSQFDPAKVVVLGRKADGELDASSLVREFTYQRGRDGDVATRKLYKPYRKAQELLRRVDAERASGSQTE